MWVAARCKAEIDCNGGLDMRAQRRLVIFDINDFDETLPAPWE